MILFLFCLFYYYFLFFLFVFFEGAPAAKNDGVKNVHLLFAPISNPAGDCVYFFFESSIRRLRIQVSSDKRKGITHTQKSYTQS